ncbi:MAG: hypothetical protein M3P08_09240 [Thermoproteota archaeon]|nr:hypothetical protein [Thermoproteota archaeon]
MQAGFEIVVFTFWLIPLILLCSSIYGYARAKLCFKTTDKTKKMIIQITTVQNQNLVNKIISTVRSYNLSMCYEIWVITEVSLLYKYVNADKVFTVLIDFRSIARFKARALDYSSQIRKDYGITTEDFKNQHYSFKKLH